MEKRHSIIPAVFLALKNDQNQYCLMRRYNTGYKDGCYSFAAGHLEGGETVKTAMVREAKEELGITINEADLELIFVSNNIMCTPERINFVFLCTKWEGKVRVCEPDKCDDIQWLSTHDMPAQLVPTTRDAINGILNKSNFSVYQD